MSLLEWKALGNKSLSPSRKKRDTARGGGGKRRGLYEGKGKDKILREEVEGGGREIMWKNEGGKKKKKGG